MWGWGEERGQQGDGAQGTVPRHHQPWGSSLNSKFPSTSTQPSPELGTWGWSRGGTSLILILVPIPFSKEFLQHRAQKMQRTSKTQGCADTSRLLHWLVFQQLQFPQEIHQMLPSQAGLGWVFEQSRLWDAAGKCPVQREPFFVLLIFRGRFPSFTACLFYNRFDAGEDKLSHKGKTTNHLAALNRLFFFPL